MFLYYDISSGDPHWTALIEHLSQEKDITIMATIREEDWRRGSALKEKVDFTELELDLTK